ncbi:DUF4326 domain-containing protein [Streptomyces thermolilacinus]
MAARIQRRRTKGWRAPEHAVYVGRPTRFGNPARLVHAPHGLVVEWPGGGTVGTWPNEREARRYATDLFKSWLYAPEQAEHRRLVRALLHGRDLLCWCPLDQPCHADVLLELATEEIR